MTDVSGKFLNEKFHKGRQLYVGKWAGDKYLGDFKNNGKNMEKAPIFGKMVINILVNGKMDKLSWNWNFTYKNGKIKKVLGKMVNLRKVKLIKLIRKQICI